MSWKSTMEITREDILKEILSRLINASDKQLEDFLVDLTPNMPFNYRVVSEYGISSCSYNYKESGL